jgi:hypothetical protein
VILKQRDHGQGSASNSEMSLRRLECDIVPSSQVAQLAGLQLGITERAQEAGMLLERKLQV